ncbi:MAG: LuxR C-terminal-related transcriptional regulator [Gemmatimonadota bacterium]
MPASEPVAPPRIQLILAAAFLVIMVGGVIDLILDQPDTLLSAHVLFEVLMVVVSLGAASYLARGWFQSSREVSALEGALERHRAERDVWREKAARALSGLGEAIGGEFDRWGLTPAERETALMLLKGHSHKRIAKVTARSERTVRQHAVAVYRKSGLGGRAELAAFFLEDLGVPGVEDLRDTTA